MRRDMWEVSGHSPGQSEPLTADLSWALHSRLSAGVFSFLLEGGDRPHGVTEQPWGTMVTEAAAMSSAHRPRAANLIPLTFWIVYHVKEGRRAAPVESSLAFKLGY